MNGSEWGCAVRSSYVRALCVWLRQNAHQQFCTPRFRHEGVFRFGYVPWCAGSDCRFHRCSRGCQCCPAVGIHLDRKAVWCLTLLRDCTCLVFRVCRYSCTITSLAFMCDGNSCRQTWESNSGNASSHITPIDLPKPRAFCLSNRVCCCRSFGFQMDIASFA